jgi:NADPH:quinone reductase-like Zn-dependent oxidoreductase
MAKTQQRALLFSEKGGQYHITTREIPRPGPGFVLVRIESCALNPVDELCRLAGILVDKYPYIAGNDGSGIVEEVGEGVTELRKGDRVCVGHLHCSAVTRPRALNESNRRVFQSPFGDHRGTFQEYALVDVPLIAKVSVSFVLQGVVLDWLPGIFQIPDNLTFDQASTIPLGLTTAAAGLYQKKQERGGADLVAPWADGGRGKYAGKPIYIPGGSGSVGQYGTNPSLLGWEYSDKI